MVTLPDTAWASRPALPRLIAALGGAETTRLVGGAVRDGLLGLAVSDIDLATRLAPNDGSARLRAAGFKAVPTGIAHGTITAVTPEGPVEVTTLRRDVATDGRHATVAFSDDWQEDAARRDFTINALYADADTGEVFDWFGGLADLNAGRVRFIGDPLTRIAEDHLRIMRFFRFHARFGSGAPDADGLAACVGRANDLMALSRERIAAELLKLLAASDPVPTVTLMIAGGILSPVLPELTDTARLAALVAREGERGDPVRRLAAMIGPDPVLAASIAARLKLSNHDAKRLSVATKMPNDSAEALAYRHGLESATDVLLLSGRDAPEFTGWQRPKLGIGGGELIARGLTPGPVVAQTLGRIEARWIEAGFPDDAARATIIAEELSRTLGQQRPAPHRDRAGG